MLPVSRFAAQPVRGTRIAIGRPISNTRIYLLDTHRGQLVPVGLPGELYVGGAGLARGYLESRGDLTRKVLSSIPLVQIQTLVYIEPETWPVIGQTGKSSF